MDRREVWGGRRGALAGVLTAQPRELHFELHDLERLADRVRLRPGSYHLARSAPTFGLSAPAATARRPRRRAPGHPRRPGPVGAADSGQRRSAAAARSG